MTNYQTLVQEIGAAANLMFAAISEKDIQVRRQIESNIAQDAIHLLSDEIEKVEGYEARAHERATEALQNYWRV